MNIATSLYFVCYIPEFYANYINKNANIYNLPEKILLLMGTLFAFTYSVQLGDMSFIVNYSLALFIDCVAISMRGYYIIINYRKEVDIQNVIKGLKELEKSMGTSPLHDKYGHADSPV
jgi:lipid-A-disaccharide synthase-like uncharacterized protein